MKENRYDDDAFFQKYAEMPRSAKGLSAAGEWPSLKAILPDFHGLDVLDVGCGYGWHCAYASDGGARSVLGLDISEKMIETARQRNARPNVTYRTCAFEDAALPDGAFDAVISSLMIHYLADYGAFVDCVRRWLRPGGRLIYTVEHPVFTAQGPQDWVYAPDGGIDHFPVDRYFDEGKRDAVFLGEHIVKYHRTLATYLGGLLSRGFAIEQVCEPAPTPEMVRDIPGMADELRRPMMLIVSARRGA